MAGGKVRGSDWGDGGGLVGVTYQVVYHIQTVGKASDVSEAGAAEE